MRNAALIVVALALTGCATHMIYLRADGHDIGGDPVLHQQFDMDRTVCQGELQKANVSGVVFTGGGLAGAFAAAARSQEVDQVGQGCMAGKGYA
jgi:hypothetical protein